MSIKFEGHITGTFTAREWFALQTLVRQALPARRELIAKINGVDVLPVLEDILTNPEHHGFEIEDNNYTIDCPS